MSSLQTHPFTVGAIHESTTFNTIFNTFVTITSTSTYNIAKGGLEMLGNCCLNILISLILGAVFGILVGIGTIVITPAILFWIIFGI